ncbi:hypothetical protein Acr_00g0049920 [Actinidia rufa]|uniref:Defective in cullin neddylation protein n=1 Tax=Actinidia rufa TaxID=165716 RepID=A0A7J0DM05_9ERIC|nr:hypothetical protein Acr_00g0049920 [Actinidia rufa]
MNPKMEWRKRIHQLSIDFPKAYPIVFDCPLIASRLILVFFSFSCYILKLLFQCPVLFLLNILKSQVGYDFVGYLKSSLALSQKDKLVLSWHMKAATMCEFSKQEFIGCLQALGIDSLEKFRDRVHFMRSDLKDEQKFHEIYNFAFGWAKEKGQKSLALDTAIGMWQLLFEEKQWPLVDHWCQFLQARHNKAISRDTWSQLLEFARMVDPKLSNYDAEGAWPYLIDEFVEYLNENGIVQKGHLNDWNQKC